MPSDIVIVISLGVLGPPCYSSNCERQTSATCRGTFKNRDPHEFRTTTNLISQEFVVALNSWENPSSSILDLQFELLAEADE